MRGTLLFKCGKIGEVGLISNLFYGQVFLTMIHTGGGHGIYYERIEPVVKFD